MQRWEIDGYELFTVGLVFPMVFVMAVIARLVKATTTKTLLWICGTMLVVDGTIFYDWSRDQEIRSSVVLVGYHVDFVERRGLLEHWRSFEITREDGKRTEFVIDGDANKCEDFRVTHAAERVYFHCSGDHSADRVSYIDTQKMILYGGFMKESRQIDELKFN